MAVNAPVDLSVAVRASTYESCAPLMAAVAQLLRPLGATFEFLLYLDHPEPECASRDLAVRVAADVVRDYRAFFDAARMTATGTWLVTLEHPTVRDASLLVAFWRQRQHADVWIASRHARDGGADVGLVRSLVSRVANAAVARTLSFSVADMTSGRRMYRRRIVAAMSLGAPGREVLIEILVRAYGEGARIGELAWHVEGPAPALPLPLALARVVRRMHHERNSGNYPDYDSRAYYSKIWLQRYWQQRRFRIISEFAGGGVCLDVGCGGSRIIKMRPEMVALDLNFHRLRHLQSTNSRRVQATAGAIPFAADTFDVVICSQVIEHTLEGTCVSECARVLKDGGILVIGTPDYGTFWWPFWEAIYDKVKPHGYVIEHIAHYTYASLTDEVRKAGCDVLDHAYIGGGELIVKAVKRAGHVAG